MQQKNQQMQSNMISNRKSSYGLGFFANQKWKNKN